MVKNALPLKKVLVEWDTYLKSVKGYSFHTIAAYRSDVSHFISFLSDHLGKEFLTLSDLITLEIRDIRSWLADRSKTNYNHRSTARAFSSAKNFFSFLERRNLILNSAIFKIRSLRVKKTLPRPLSIENALTLIEKIELISKEKWIGKRDKALFALIYSGGLRINEALSLNYNDFTQASDFLTITGKGGKKRSIPFLENVKKIINDYLKVVPIVFESNTPLFLGAKYKRLNASVADKQMRRYREVEGLEHFATPHALRHSCASHLMESSGDIKGIQDLLGHASLSTTQIYTEINQEYLIKAYKKFHPRSSE